MKKLMLLLALFIMAFAETATLTWKAPTSRSDGSAMPLVDIAAYNIYYGKVSPVTTTNSTKVVDKITASNPSLAQMTYVITLTEYNETYYFGVTTMDIYGRESGFSNMVSKTTSLAPEQNSDK